MVADLDRILEEDVLAKECEKRKHQRITGQRDNRVHSAASVLAALLWEVAAPKQCSFQQVSPAAARGGNGFIDNGCIAPDESTPFCHQTTEEVQILAAGVELLVKYRLPGGRMDFLNSTFPVRVWLHSSLHPVG